jgi:MYXO-CTERM domain-containing protein
MLLLLWSLAANAGTPCEDTVISTLTCTSVVQGKLAPGPWGVDGQPAANNCPDGFDTLNSDLGATCDYEDDELFGGLFNGCVMPLNACSGDSYSCGGLSWPTSGQNGPDDVYAFSCQQSGSVTIAISNMDCDLDLYVIDDTCDIDLGCVTGSTASFVTEDSVTFDCVAGTTYYVIVEGYGFTYRGVDDYDYGADPGWCFPEDSTVAADNSLGNYSLSFEPGDPATSGCVEICDDGIDNEGDGLTDCDDDDCLGDPACPEICDNTADDDGDLLVDCDDDGCWDFPTCCDDDADGFDDVACGGTDCNDRSFDPLDADLDGWSDSCDQCPAGDDASDPDGDGAPTACDDCPSIANDQADVDADGIGDACDNCLGNSPDSDGDGMPDVCDPCPNIAFEADDDGDGSVSCLDCDDLDPLRNANDVDADGVSTCAGDCWDGDALVQPGATELPDGIDEDCDALVDEGTAWFDDDGDGFTEAGGDCDDASAAVNPGAVETCDGVDQDCDARIDDGTPCADDDGDGWCEAGCTDGSIAGDCADGDAAAHPGAAEIPGNGVDDNCDGSTDGGITDADGDGYAASADCDDAVATMHAGAVELANGQDDDCDGTTDEGTSLYDDDGDGTSEADGDCDDGDPGIHQGASEGANGVDDDCDGEVDEGTARSDDDGDGFSDDGGDCDDLQGGVYPGAPEVSDGRDNDCDGDVDEGDGDGDADGWTVAQGDCDDEQGWANPEVDEVCDGIDNNCDGQVDEGCADDVAPSSGGCGCATGAPRGSALALLALAAANVRKKRRSIG